MALDVLDRPVPTRGPFHLHGPGPAHFSGGPKEFVELDNLALHILRPNKIIHPVPRLLGDDGPGRSAQSISPAAPNPLSIGAAARPEARAKTKNTPKTKKPLNIAPPVEDSQPTKT